MPQDRRRQALRDAAVVVAMTLLVSVALEGAARLAGFGEGPAPLPPKVEGSFRIVALGASTVVGVPAGALGFVAHLTATLPDLAPGRAVDVVNRARSGKDSDFVRRELERALADEPDLFIVLTGHNEFLTEPPRAGFRGLLQRLREASAAADMLAAGARRLGLAAPRAELALPDRVTPVDRHGARFAEAVAAFRANLAAIVDGARAHGVPLILCTAPSNLADWPPVHDAIAWSHPDPDYDADIARLEDILAAGRHAALLADVAALRVRHGDDAMLDWLEATSLRALGRDDDARALFHRARETDPWPLRALDTMNDSVRAYANTPGVRVVDAERLFERHAPDGFVGFELVADNVHPTPLGNALLAREIARVMSEEGWLVPATAHLGSVAHWEATAWRRLGGAEAQRAARARWLLSNAIYALKSPFLNRGAARVYLQRARAIAPGDWRIWANLGALSLFEGDVERGRRQLARATALKGGLLDPRRDPSIPYLQEALERAGLTPDALSPAVAGGS
jgi:lysophospholipase L1-like esterase